MTDFIQMPRAAKSYWFLVVAAGCCCLARSLSGWHFQDEGALKLSIYLVGAIFASSLKIHVPGIFGTISMCFIVNILAMLDLSLNGAIAVAVVSTLGQCLIRPDHAPKWFQVVFSTAGIPVPILVAGLVLKSHWLLLLDQTGSVALLAASMTYFAINTFTVAGIISCTAGKHVFETWRRSYLWTAPQYLAGGALAGATHYLGNAWGWPALLMTAPPLYLVYRSYSLHVERIDEQQKHNFDLSRLQSRTIETLALAIDAKDDTTAAHLRRVQVYAVEIGREMNLPASEIKALEAAALLHDVGKLAVPEYIISKPGKLTEEEFEKMKIHPVVGAEILERVQFPYPVVPIVRAHHEKFDGTGYPDGLAGEQIPIGARILSAVDCLDALASARQYRPAVPLEDAMRIVAEQSGKSYDPKVVAILQRRFRELELKAKAETTEPVRLSSKIKVERGSSPATGFADREIRTSDTGPVSDFGPAIANARREFQSLVEVTNDAANSLGIDETLALLAVRVNRIVEHDAMAIYLAQGDKLTPRYVKGESFRLLSSLEIPVGQGLSGWVAQNNLPILNGNPAVEFGYMTEPQPITQFRSAVSVPLRSKDKIVGVLTLYSLRAAAFSADHRRILLAVAPKMVRAIQNSLRFGTAANRATDTDELTGLANARSLFAHLQREVTDSAHNGKSFAVMMIDLDGFRNTNDRYGRQTGDRILQTVSEKLRRSCGTGDLAARAGGDEFVVVLSGVAEHVDATIARIEEMMGTLAAETDCGAEVPFSVGVSRYPNDGSDPVSLLEKAEERTDEAKRRKSMFLVTQGHAAPNPKASAAVA